MKKTLLIWLSALGLLLAACAGEAPPQTAAEPPGSTQADEQPPEPPSVPPLEAAAGMQLAAINWIIEGETLTMFGLAENRGASDLQDVLVMVRLLDAGGQVIDAGSRELPVVPAGGRAPFITQFSTSLDWEDHETVFLELPPGPNTVLGPESFEIANIDETAGTCHSVPDSAFNLGVEVRFVGLLRGDVYELLVALFDAQGNIIGVSAAWICSELDDGIHFEVSVGRAELAAGEVADYEIFVYGYLLGE